MPAFLARSAAGWIKVLCLAGLLLLLAAPAPAQEQTPKDQTPPPATAPKPGVKAKMPAPRRAPVAMPQKSEAESLRGRQEDSLEMKKSSGRIGGQEVPHKKSEPDQ